MQTKREKQLKAQARLLARRKMFEDSLADTKTHLHSLPLVAIRNSGYSQSNLDRARFNLECAIIQIERWIKGIDIELSNLKSKLGKV